MELQPPEQPPGPQRRSGHAAEDPVLHRAERERRRMGHLSISGEDGTMAAFAPLRVRRKVFIHLDTTNPVLLDDSEERCAVTRQGWEVAYDGMVLDG